MPEIETLKVKTITPERAGKIIGKSAEFIRAGLRQNRFPFGTAVLSNTGQYNYIILENKFLKWLEVKVGDNKWKQKEWNTH